MPRPFRMTAADAQHIPRQAPLGSSLTSPRIQLIPVEEAARLLGIGRSMTYDLIRSGQLRSVKIGKRRLVPAFAIDEAIERLSQEWS